KNAALPDETAVAGIDRSQDWLHPELGVQESQVLAIGRETERGAIAPPPLNQEPLPARGRVQHQDRPVEPADGDGRWVRAALDPRHVRRKRAPLGLELDRLPIKHDPRNNDVTTFAGLQSDPLLMDDDLVPGDREEIRLADLQPLSDDRFRAGPTEL